MQEKFGNDWSIVRNIKFPLIHPIEFKLFISFPGIMFFAYRLKIQKCFSCELKFTISEEKNHSVRRNIMEKFSPGCIEQMIKHPSNVMH